MGRPMQLARGAGLLTGGSNDAAWQTEALAGAAEDAAAYLAAEDTGDRAAGAR
jgi:hypothetical protein